MTLFRIDEEILATQNCYRTILSALSRPGTLHTADFGSLKGPFSSDTPMPLRVIAKTLLDERVSLSGCGKEALIWEEEIIKSTGVRRSPLNLADYVIASSVPDINDLQRVKQGSLLSPEDGATVVVWLQDGINGSIGSVEISGPGVKKTITLEVGSEMLSLMRHHIDTDFEYPLGFELLVVGREGRLIGLPRTSTVRVAV